MARTGKIKGWTSSAGSLAQLGFFLLAFAAPCFPAVYQLPASTGTHRVVFSADNGDFNENTRVINLEGDVQLDEVGDNEKLVKNIKARRLTVDQLHNTVRAPEDFVLNDSSGTIYGKSGVFDYAANTGYINDGRFAYKSFYFSGKRMEITPQRYLYKKASVTTCEDTPPHFRIRSSRLYLAPDKYFLAYNNLFYIGPVPIFYFPVLYKPLIGGTPFVSSFAPGYDARSGVFVKSTYSYRFTPQVKGKLFLDYFSRRGLGTGGEVDYRQAERTNANVSGYRIRESGAEHDRWGMNGGFWHSMNRFNESDNVSYYTQSSFRLLSDPQFNNDYFRANPFAISPDKQANIAVTRRSATTVTRLSADSRYVRSADFQRFEKSSESAPRVDFQRLPFTVGRKLQLVNSFSGFFENAKDPGTSYYQRRGNAGWTVSKALPLVRHLTLMPSASYNESLFISTTAAAAETWIGRYSFNTNLRYDRLWGSLDMSYAYQARMVKNRLGKDRLASDRGEEVKSVASQLFISPVYNTYFRTTASYDMRDGMGGSFSHRLSTMTAEYYYSPKPNLDIFLQDSYRFGDGNKSFVAQMYSGDEKKYVGAGFAYYTTVPDSYVLNNMFGFLIPWAPTWRAECVLRYKVGDFTTSRNRKVQFFERGLTLYKDFHDFHTTWFYKERHGVHEFFFLVRLKVNAVAKADPFDEASRNDWHPWRRPGQLRD